MSYFCSCYNFTVYYLLGDDWVYQIGNSLLILAAKQKQREVCEFLLSKGVDASVKNKDGLTAADVCSDAVMKV